jgi:hypothetical protein
VHGVPTRQAGGVAERFYRITVSGVLTDRFATAFEPLTVIGTDGVTVVSGVCADSAALYGILDRMRDLGLELLGVESSEPARR